MSAISHGLCGYEKQVMDLWDQGKSIEDIAKLLSYSRDRVASIVSYLSPNRREDGWQAPAAAATETLAARILEVHGVMA